MGSRFLKMVAGLIFVLCGQQVAALPPAWSDETYGQGATPQNRRGPNPSYATAAFKPQAALPFGKLEDDGGSGSGNYSFSLPLLALPGRGLPLRLDLLFSSQVWSDLGNGEMLFDADGDWPSPGWSLGFGRLLTTTDKSVPGSDQVLQGLLLSGNHGRQSLTGGHEAGNHRHLRLPGESTATIEICCYDPAYSDKGTSAVMSDGAGGSITFTNFEPGNKSSIYYPVQLTDANGNFISINYVVKAGKPQPPRIDSIVDTVGRWVRFYYDAAEHLVTITGPGLESEETVYARFVYTPRSVDIRTGASCKPFHTVFEHLLAVVLPATNHGFFMPSPTSTYGTNTWFSQSTQVQFQASSFAEQPTLANWGRETSSSVFDYAVLSATDCISKPPGYTTRTDTWRDDVDGVPKTATTNYSVDPGNGSDDITVVTKADSSASRQFVSTLDDGSRGLLSGQVRRVENLDPSGIVLSSTDFEWSLVRNAPRQRAIVQNIDPLGRGKRTTFEYDPTYPFVLTTTRFYGYSDGQTAARLEHSVSTTFVRDAEVVAAGFLTLPQTVVHTATQSSEQTVRTFEYDKKSLTAVGKEVAHHGQDYEPHDKKVCAKWDTSVHPPECVEWKSVAQTIVTVRGNLTRMTDFADATNRANPVSQNFEYDSTGNVLRAYDDLGAGTASTFGPESQFSLPTMVVVGSVDSASPLRTTTTLEYYFGTGLPKSLRDRDGRLTSYEYRQGDAGWRISLVSTQDKGSTAHAYDDDNLYTIIATYDPATNATKDSVIVFTDGMGRVRRRAGVRGVPFQVEIEYDPMGRIVRQSGPYDPKSTDPNAATPIWTTQSFDGLGRLKTLKTPGNPVAAIFAYDVAVPSIVPTSPLAGGTVLSVDPWGRQTWKQSDSSGNLKYVVETVAPLAVRPPSLTPSEQPSPNQLTQYQYDVFGRLRTITFAKQTRMFDYDDLGRLVGQTLPERQATLDVTGVFRGQTGTRRYSDVFQYDARSNLVTRIDARGVRTKFGYDDDPLNRLQWINYDVPSAHDESSPIVAVAPVTFTYKSASPTHVESVSNNSWNIVFDYDTAWRLRTQTTTYTAYPEQHFEFHLDYDTFARVKTLEYPIRYTGAGVPGPRRTLGTGYGGGSVLTQVKLDDQLVVGPVTYATGGMLRSVPRQLPGGSVTERFEADPATGLPFSHTVESASGTPLFGQTFDFRRVAGDVNSAISGQVTSIRNSVKPELSQLFVYDPTGRLGKSVTGDVKATAYDANALWQDYSYDQYGNRTGLDSFRVKAFPCGVAATPACIYTAATDSERDGVATLVYEERTNRVAGTDFKYDAAGGLLRAVSTINGVARANTFVYDAAGRIANVSDGAGTVLEEFEYGPDRRRFRTTSYSNGPLSVRRDVYYGWLGNSMLSQSAVLVTLGPTRHIEWSQDHFYALGRRQFSESSIGRDVYVNDSRGTGAVISPTNTGSAIDHRASRPFGTEAATQIYSDDERFTTYKRSRATGVDYAVNRFYSAELGRFLQPDPIGPASFRVGDSQSLNGYSYARNDPINRTDASGLEDCVGFRLPGGQCMALGIVKHADLYDWSDLQQISASFSTGWRPGGFALGSVASAGASVAMTDITATATAAVATRCLAAATGLAVAAIPVAAAGVAAVGFFKGLDYVQEQVGPADFDGPLSGGVRGPTDADLNWTATGATAAGAAGIVAAAACLSSMSNRCDPNGLYEALSARHRELGIGFIFGRYAVPGELQRLRNDPLVQTVCDQWMGCGSPQIPNSLTGPIRNNILETICGR